MEMCRLCLLPFKSNNISFSLKESKVFKDNTERIKLISNIFNALSLKILDCETVDKHRICCKCDDLLLSLVVFLEMCLVSDKFWTSEVPKSNFELNSIELTANSSNLTTAHPRMSPDKAALSEICQSLNQENFQCLHCLRKFPSVWRLEAHRQQHISSHVCEKCGWSFRSLRALNLHRNKKHSELMPEKMLPTRCEEQSKSKKHLDCQMLQETHEAPLPLEASKDLVIIFTCDICNEFFDSKSLLRKHMKGHTKIHVCFCGEAFDRPCKLLRHDAIVHRQQDPNVIKCSKCGKSFKTLSSLAYHQNHHLGLKPYLCNICPEAYATPYGLKQHRRRKHMTQSLPPLAPTRFLCHACGASFSRKTHLHRHAQNRHSDAPLAYTCDRCGKAFKSQDNLNNHLRNHDAERCYACSDCQKAFKSRHARQQHVDRVHLGLRPFPCSTCGHAFKSKSHLTKHIRTHTGERPHSCPLCPYASAEESNLKKHIKVHDRGR